MTKFGKIVDTQIKKILGRSPWPVTKLNKSRFGTYIFEIFAQIEY